MNLLEVTSGNLYLISEDVDAARTLADAVRAEMGEDAARYIEQFADDIETLSDDLEDYYTIEGKLYDARRTIDEKEKALETAQRKIVMLQDRIDALEKALIDDPIPFM